MGKFLEEQGVSHNFVVLAPGAASPDKRWPPKGFAITADHIIEKYGYDVVLVGDDSEKYLIENVLNQMSDANRGKVKSLVGQLSLIELAGLFERSKMVLANDSGPAHLASYFDVPLLVLFGPTDPFFYGPWGENGQYLREYNPEIFTESAGDPLFAMKKILPDRVKDTIQKILS